MKMRLLISMVVLLALAAVVVSETDSGLTVHEWGTFTSVQGADGVQINWNPHIAPELPKFVYDRVHAGTAAKAKIPGIIVAGKNMFTSLQRMETPVIYFYSEKPRTVDVSVRFPQGNITEWYPQENAADTREPWLRGQDAPALHWEKVQVRPSHAPEEVVLPSDSIGSHYYAARETDSSQLLVSTAYKKTEAEKFLFYRGIAGFAAPLTVKLDSADSARLSLTNTHSEEIPCLFVCEVERGDYLSWMPVEALKPGETRSVVMNKAGSKSEGTESLAAALRAALVKQGLYPKEAAAMVKTWQSSWLGEPGRRVLYLLPRGWTDGHLPLTVTPAPQRVERVMVARAEIITPAMEQAMLSVMERYAASEASERPKIVEETRALGFGRFTEAVLTRVWSANSRRSNEFSTLSLNLLNAVSTPAPSPAASAN